MVAGRRSEYVLLLRWHHSGSITTVDRLRAHAGSGCTRLPHLGCIAGHRIKKSSANCTRTVHHGPVPLGPPGAARLLAAFDLTADSFALSAVMAFNSTFNQQMTPM